MNKKLVINFFVIFMAVISFFSAAAFIKTGDTVFAEEDSLTIIPSPDSLLFQIVGNFSKIEFNVTTTGSLNEDLTQWFVDDIFDKVGSVFDYTPSAAGIFTVKAVNGAYTDTKQVHIIFAQVSEISIDYGEAELLQYLGSQTTVNFSAVIGENVDPETAVAWYVNDNLEETSKNFSYYPAGVGTYEIKLVCGNFTAVEILKVIYVPVTEFTVTVTGELSQKIDNMKSVSFSVSYNSFADPDIKALWFVNNVFKESAKTFAFTPQTAGEFNVVAKIGTTAVSNKIIVDYLPVETENKKVTVIGNKNQNIDNIEMIIFKFPVSVYNNPQDIVWEVDGEKYYGNELWFTPKLSDRTSRYFVVKVFVNNSEVDSIIVSVTDTAPIKTEVMLIVFISSIALFILGVIYSAVRLALRRRIEL